MNVNNVANWGILHEIELPLIQTVLSVFERRNDSLTDNPEIEKNVPEIFKTWLEDDGTGSRYAVSGEEEKFEAKVMFCRSFCNDTVVPVVIVPMAQTLEKARESEIHLVISEPDPPKAIRSVMSIFDMSEANILISLDPDDGMKYSEVEFVTNISNILDGLEKCAACCPEVTVTPWCLMSDELRPGIPINAESDVQIVLRLIETPMFEKISPSF